ncbi:MAG: hypothetical protein Kow0080_09930 [Candidatus Promineifilaceae bacterium]
MSQKKSPIHLPPTIIAQTLRQALADGSHPQLKVTSHSMTPFLQKDDRLFLENAAITALHPGDVVTIVSDVALFTHRFWQRQDDNYFLTKGDRANQLDAPWQNSQFIGRVCAVQRGHRILSLTDGPGAQLQQRLMRWQHWWWPVIQQNGRFPVIIKRPAKALLYFGSWLLCTTVMAAASQTSFEE